MKKSHMRSARLLLGTMAGGWLALVPGTTALAAEPAARPARVWEALATSGTQVTCFGSNRTLYSPPVSGVPQPGSMIHSSLYGACLSVLGSPVSSARVVSTRVDYLGYTCEEVLGSGPERFTVLWNNGEHSELLLAPAEVDVQDTTTTVTYMGEVVGGKFRGVGAVRSWTFLNTDFTSRCLSSEGLPETNVFAMLVLARLTTSTP